MPQVDKFVSVREAKNKLLDLIRRMKHKQEIDTIKLAFRQQCC